MTDPTRAVFLSYASLDTVEWETKLAMKSRAILLGLMLVAAPCFAGPQQAWVFTGHMTLKGEDLFVFFDEASVKKLGSGHIQTWQKLLTQDDVAFAAQKLTGGDKKQLDEMRANRKLPQVASLFDLTESEIQNIRVREYIANKANLDPAGRILMEFDCTGERWRPVSGWTHINGKDTDYNQPGPWTPIAPEESNWGVMKIACPKA